ncbi:helix-turn-helix domain-containing protein [Catenulispora rubra]|uniref:helix-turn-helix domain-containing protein n=1 Tax=Catenulispora rubra TaxID=280293 RepID=UPI00189266D9|nr:helix-turn-helix transcriptional regulator [Catenulispora rubra]
MDERDREAQFNLELGRNIRRLRLDAGLVQAQLARMTGVSRASITNVEAGSQAPPPYRLARIAEALGVRVAELMPEISEIGQPPLTPSFANALASVMALADRQAEEGGHLGPG